MRFAPSQQCRQGTQHNDEARCEHHLLPVATEQRPAECQSAIRQADIPPISPQQAEADTPADRIAHNLPDNRAHRGGQNDECNVQLMRRPRIHGGRDKQGLARQRKAEAFQPDDNAQHHIAICVKKLDEMVN